jgi:hypothetical protein
MNFLKVVLFVITFAQADQIGFNRLGNTLQDPNPNPNPNPNPKFRGDQIKMIRYNVFLRGLVEYSKSFNNFFCLLSLMCLKLTYNVCPNNV